MSERWKDWFNKQPQDVKDRIAIAAIDRLFEIDELRFREKDEECDEEYIYYESCGEPL